MAVANRLCSRPGDIEPVNYGALLRRLGDYSEPLQGMAPAAYPELDKYVWDPVREVARKPHLSQVFCRLSMPPLASFLLTLSLSLFPSLHASLFPFLLSASPHCSPMSSPSCACSQQVHPTYYDLTVSTCTGLLPQALGGPCHTFFHAGFGTLVGIK